MREIDEQGLVVIVICDDDACGQRHHPVDRSIHSRKSPLVGMCAYGRMKHHPKQRATWFGTKNVTQCAAIRQITQSAVRIPYKAGCARVTLVQARYEPDPTVVSMENQVLDAMRTVTNRASITTSR